VRKQSSFETRRKRESIAVMEQNHHRRGESEGLIESPHGEERFTAEEEEESPDETRGGGRRRRRRRKREFPNTLWEYLKEEVKTGFSLALTRSEICRN